MKTQIQRIALILGIALLPLQAQTEDDLKAELLDLYKMIEQQMESELKSIDMRIQNMRSESEVLKEESAHLMEESKRMKEDVERLRKEADMMVEDADRVREDAENLEFESQALLKEADDLEGKITDMSRIEQIRERIKELEK